MKAKFNKIYRYFKTDFMLAALIGLWIAIVSSSIDSVLLSFSIDGKGLVFGLGCITGLIAFGHFFDKQTDINI